MGLFVALVNGFQLLANAISIFDVTAVLLNIPPKITIALNVNKTHHFKDDL